MGSNLLTQEEIDALLSGPPELSELERDVLLGILRGCTCQVASTLSEMLNASVQMEIKDVFIPTGDSVTGGLGYPLVGCSISCSGFTEGRSLVMMAAQDVPMLSGAADAVSQDIETRVAELAVEVVSAAAEVLPDLFSEEVSCSFDEVQLLSSEEDAVEFVNSIGESIVQAEYEILLGEEGGIRAIQLFGLDFAKEMVYSLNSEGNRNGSVGEESPQPVRPGMAGRPEVPPVVASSGGTESQVARFDLIRNIPVRIRAVLGRRRLPIEKILSLGPGSVVELDSVEGQPIEILVNDTLIARGEVVVVGDTFGVRVVEVATPQERAKSVS